MMVTVIVEIFSYVAVAVVASLTSVFALRLYRSAPHYLERPVSHLLVALLALALGAMGLAAMRIGSSLGEGASALSEAVALTAMVVSMSFFIAVSMDVRDGKL